MRLRYVPELEIFHARTPEGHELTLTLDQLHALPDLDPLTDTAMACPWAWVVVGEDL